ncbi:SRPBCC domain-containing protein [Haloferax namakaokahaiae]|uniref:SRPBCC domain-containing protein n=1 Tax=Haloferax namakaokahaiae TaxID=1748331 RepID=A0ABD5ZCQ4_9EURY
MPEIRTERMINAPPAVVWAVLTDFSSYPAWNPHLVKVTSEDDLRVGSKLKLDIRREGVKDRSMTVTVTELIPGRKLEWVGTLVSPLVFTGRHTFELEPFAGDRTRFLNYETSRGVLDSLVTTADPERDYESMNEALKWHAETATAAPA